MANRFVAFLLMVHFLAGSVVFPLGDFTLMKDIPQMYRACTKKADPKEAGIIDFVGDYLLSGKILLGHNKSDRPENGNSVQFQHASDFNALACIEFSLLHVIAEEHYRKYFSSHVPGNTTDFHPYLFRPPLAIA